MNRLILAGLVLLIVIVGILVAISGGIVLMPIVIIGGFLSVTLTPAVALSVLAVKAMRKSAGSASMVERLAFGICGLGLLILSCLIYGLLVYYVAPLLVAGLIAMFIGVCLIIYSLKSPYATDDAIGSS